MSIINILGKLKIPFLVYNICPQFLGLDSLVWIPGFGFLGLESWAWIPGLGLLGLESWVWSPGLGVLGLDSWIWTPGLNLLPEVIKPKRFEQNLQILGSPPRFSRAQTGEGGPETHFFLQALHKLARALQTTLPWQGGLDEIPLILHMRIFSMNPSR